MKAEQHQDAMLLARERMQKKLDEDAAIYAKKKEEVREGGERERERERFFIEITTYNREKHRREMKRLNNGRHLKL